MQHTPAVLPAPADHSCSSHCPCSTVGIPGHAAALGFPRGAVISSCIAPLSQVGVLSPEQIWSAQRSVAPFVFVRGNGIISRRFPTGQSKIIESFSLEKSFKIKCKHEILRESLFFPSLHTSAFKCLIPIMGRVWMCDSSS